MSKYKELIKNLDTVRAYMRDFFIYGYKTRNDYDEAKRRTYDNERRRMENYLGEYVHWYYGKDGKVISLTLDTARIAENPFYKIFQCKSFTNNDIVLHMCLLDLFSENEERTVRQVAEEIIDAYGIVFDQQTVRAKLKEYTALGIMNESQTGRTVTYRLATVTVETLMEAADMQPLLQFFSEYSPVGIVGTYLLQRMKSKGESPFYYKHHFFAPALDTVILLHLLRGIHEKRWLTITYQGRKENASYTLQGFPLQLLQSVATGRQYVIFTLYRQKKYVYTVLRLDRIQEVTWGKECSEALPWRQQFLTDRQYFWGTSFENARTIRQLEMKLFIGDDEQFVLQRLKRERRQGRIQKESNHVYVYTIAVYHVGEMLNWVKSYIGHIISVTTSVEGETKKIYDDMYRLLRMYDISDEPIPAPATLPTTRLKKKIAHPAEPRTDWYQVDADEEVFSEIYGIYYRIVAALLETPSWTKEALITYISTHGTSDTTMEAMPKLLNGTWPLFTERGQHYLSKMSHMASLPLTSIEIAWLRTILADEKSNLFLSSAEKNKLAAMLLHTGYLYGKDDIIDIDREGDGDSFGNVHYQHHFQVLLKGIQDHAILEITYQTARGKRIKGLYIPVKLEYSAKNDKFRCYCIYLMGKKERKTTINVGRIKAIAPTGKTSPQPIDDDMYFSGSLIKEPLCVEVYDERNGIERFMVEFSTYQKKTVYDKEKKTCYVEIYYAKADEIEIVTKILSFGPVIRVLGPDSFIALITARLRRQRDLLMAERGVSSIHE